MGAEYARGLAALQGADEPRFGGKSANLGELLAAGIPVPPGFGISTDAFRAFLEEAGLADRAAQVTASDPGDIDAVGAVSHAIGEAMRSAHVPDGVYDAVARAYGELAAAAGIASPPVAVRSSAVGEDSKDATFAGQQETYLWIRGEASVCDAVLDCWISLYSPQAISYRARMGRGSAQAPAMGVTVQLMVDARASGVLFTCNPVTGDPSVVAINASWGLGLAVVGGEVTPDDLLVSKVTGEVVREHVNHKAIEYVPDERGRGTVRVEVAPERRDARCLDDRPLAALVEVARRVERHFGGHQDIEWAIARGSEPPDGLFIVQARPVTATGAPERAAPPASAMAAVMSTFGAGRPREEA
jgi:pyruvate, water dikinase